MDDMIRGAQLNKYPRTLKNILTLQGFTAYNLTGGLDLEEIYNRLVDAESTSGRKNPLLNPNGFHEETTVPPGNDGEYFLKDAMRRGKYSEAENIMIMRPELGSRFETGGDLRRFVMAIYRQLVRDYRISEEECMFPEVLSTIAFLERSRALDGIVKMHEMTGVKPTDMQMNTLLDVIPEDGMMAFVWVKSGKFFIKKYTGHIRTDYKCIREEKYESTITDLGDSGYGIESKEPGEFFDLESERIKIR
jgi:hypothetical protein